MEKDWVPIYTTASQFQAELIRGMLQENGIESVIINRKDTTYGIFGEISLYVFKGQAEEAGALLRDAGDL